MSDLLRRRVEDEKMVKTRKCPVCMWDISIPKNSTIGDLLICKSCGAQYELQSSMPLRLRPLNFYDECEVYEGFELNDGYDIF